MTHRNGPVVEHKVIVHSDGREEWVPAITGQSQKYAAPASIKIVLSEDGDGSKWDIGNWLRNALARWSEEEITLSLVCFDFSIVKTNLLNQLVPLDGKHRWKVLMLTDGKDLTNTAILDKILNAHIDELYIYPSDIGSENLNPRIVEAVKYLVDLRGSRM